MEVMEFAQGLLMETASPTRVNALDVILATIVKLVSAKNRSSFQEGCSEFFNFWYS